MNRGRARREPFLIDASALEALPRLLSSAIRCRHAINSTIAPSSPVCLRAHVHTLAGSCGCGRLWCRHNCLVLPSRQGRQGTLLSKTHSIHAESNINHSHRMNFSTCLRRRNTALATTHGTRRSRHHPACTITTRTFAIELIHLTLPFRYLVAKLLSPLLGCNINILRAQNLLALIFIFWKVLQIRRLIQPRGHGQWKAEALHPKPDEDSLEDHIWSEADQTPSTTALTAFNIASFPPLFFFGALYYTDVMSTAAVLISYSAFLQRAAKHQKRILDDLFAVFIGVVALFFRQTNIFWVAVFPAGLAVIETLKENGRTTSSAIRQGYVAVLQEAWSKGTVRDRSLRDGGFALSGELTSRSLDVKLTIARCHHVTADSCNYCLGISLQNTEGCHPLRHPPRPVHWICCLERQRRSR